jgi:hypothetical protein
MWKKLIPLPNICPSWSFSIPKHFLRAGVPDAAPIYLQSHHPLKRDQHLNGTDEKSKDSGRRTSGISPGQFVTKLAQNLSVGHEVWQRDFVADSLPERWASTSATAWTARMLLPTIRIPNGEFGHQSAADAELTPERALPSILCSTEGWLRVLMPE